MEIKNFPGDSGGPSSRPRFDDSITQLIRSAERFISQRKFTFAREQLGVARTIDPKNSYIDAIMERITVLEHQNSRAAASTPAGEDYLSVSVGPEFAGGVRESDPFLSNPEIQTRIRQLTTMAERLMDRGSLESAFDSLMKAYLLDPVSPYVLSCERNVLPAWQALHQHHSLPSSSQEEESVNTIRTTAPPSDQADQKKRLEVLKLQKDTERREHERALWREASDPPTVFGIAKAAEQKKNAAQQEEERSLFTKLKLGKFLSQ